MGIVIDTINHEVTSAQYQVGLDVEGVSRYIDIELIMLTSVQIQRRIQCILSETNTS